MNRSSRCAVYALLGFALTAPVAFGDDAHHPDQKGAAPKTAKDAGMPMGMMQDNMLKMHEQMHKVMQAKDSKERDKLMQEHMQMMQEQMKMMGGMMGGDGKGGMTDAPAHK